MDYSGLAIRYLNSSWILDHFYIDNRFYLEELRRP